MIKTLTAALVSFGIGAFIGFVISNEINRKKYDEKMNQEFSEMRKERQNQRREEKLKEEAEALSKKYDTTSEDIEQNNNDLKKVDVKDRPKYRSFYPNPAEHIGPKEKDEGEELTAIPKDQRTGPLVYTDEELDELEHISWYSHEDIDYFESDDVFADSQGEIVEDIEDTFGLVAIKVMRETDVEMIHVVDESTYMYYDILRNKSSYSDFINGEE